MKTATSGYIQRRMVKVAEDTMVHYDGTVRNSSNNIIQFAYGNNYLNPSYTIIKKGQPCPFDVERIINRENYRFVNGYNKKVNDS